MATIAAIEPTVVSWAWHAGHYRLEIFTVVLIWRSLSLSTVMMHFRFGMSPSHFTNLTVICCWLASCRQRRNFKFSVSHDSCVDIWANESSEPPFCWGHFRCLSSFTKLQKCRLTQTWGTHHTETRAPPSLVRFSSFLAGRILRKLGLYKLYKCSS